VRSVLLLTAYRLLLTAEKMKFAKYIFYIAGIWGVVILAPQYFLEAKTSLDYPPAIAHPEFYYGFVGVALAFQFVFLIIGRDPLRYRPMMIPAVIEKFSFAAAVIILFLQNRIPDILLAFGFIDLAFGTLFIVSFLKTSGRA